MNYRVNTNKESCTLWVRLRSAAGAMVRLIVKAEDQQNTVFTNRYKTVNGDCELMVRMPLSPKVSVISVYDEKAGNLPKEQTTTFEVVSIEKKGLQRRLDIADIADPKIYSFVVLAQRFCYNAGWLEPNKYQSDDKRFYLDYMNTILDKKNGKELPTPARISRFTEVIDVSRKMFVPMTVPGRMAVLCHEYAHLNMNKDIRNEEEADLNGLLIYLGLGYPRIEACEVFLKTFYNAATDSNWQRFQKMERFINEFEKLNFVMA